MSEEPEPEKRVSDTSPIDFSGMIWLDDGMRDKPQPRYLEGKSQSTYQREQIALKESQDNQNLNGFQLVRKYARGDHDAVRILMKSLLKYGSINFWCFVYDLDKKGIYGKDITAKYNENDKDLFKFYLSIWSGAEGVISDIEEGKAKPS
jgi:hypothetical protein